MGPRLGLLNINTYTTAILHILNSLKEYGTWRVEFYNVSFDGSLHCLSTIENNWVLVCSKNIAISAHYCISFELVSHDEKLTED